MKKLTIEAHDLDAIDLTEYNVQIVDRSEEPWSVTFVGTEEALIRMYQDHWDPDELPDLEDA